MSWGVLNAVMLAGLIGTAIPILIHLFNRRRDPVVDWGAMQFLELGARARRRLQLTELLLMLARVGLLAAVALALARPYVGGGLPALGFSAGNRDVVLVVDASASMDRRLGDGETAETPRVLAVRAARALVDQLAPGDSVALLAATDRVQPVIDPPVYDHDKIKAGLDLVAGRPGRGSSELPTALAEAFRILERTQNPAREVVILTDGQRSAWRPGDAARWALVRDLYRRLPVSPRIWVVAAGRDGSTDLPNATVGPPRVSRALVTPGLPLTVTSELRNAGPGPIRRTVDLLVDGRVVPGLSQTLGPIPEGGRAPLVFKTALPTPGSHLVTVALGGEDDGLPADDSASVAVDVAPALPVLLVDGEPGREPLTSETDFLRAALAPRDDDTPRVQAQVVPIDQFRPAMVQGRSVVVLANVERLDLDQTAAVARWLDGGGGLLMAPGDRTDPAYFNGLAWMPATLADRTGDFLARKVVAHPAPGSFTGPVFGGFAAGESPPLGQMGLFGYRRLEPSDGAKIVARLDTGEPWAVERGLGKGRVLLLAGPVDAEGGTLPVNPDFVPLVHEWVFHLAGGAEPRAVTPGEPLIFDLNPPPPADVATLPIILPDDSTARAVVTRHAGMARARFEETTQSGVYRLTLPDPPGGQAYATVNGDDRESEPDPLDPAEAARLSADWPLTFESDVTRLNTDLFANGTGGRRELWRGLILVALGGLCVEIYLTRRLVRGQGLNLPEPLTPTPDSA